MERVQALVERVQHQALVERVEAQVGRVLRGPVTGNDSGGGSSVMAGAALSPLTATAPSVPQLYGLFSWPISTDGSIARGFLVSFLLACGGGKCVLCAALWPCQLCGTSYGSRSI